MGTRVLRQHYDGVRTDVDAALGAPVEPWLRHRRRFIASLGALTDEQWRAPTRCTEWDVKDVVAHLVSADAFWVVSLSAARAGGRPTTHLEGFDPSTSLEPLVSVTRATSADEILQQFVTGTDTLADTVGDFSPDDWSALAESPLGHLEARFIFAHSFWDAWLHERDIGVPAGWAVPVETDELLAATWFTFFVAGVQGGLLADPAPVGAGLARPVDATVRFDDLPGALHVRLDEGVRIEVSDPAAASPAGSALDLAERFAGRRARDFGALPDADLAAHFERGAAIL